jgi:hypothetical protein
MTNAQLWFFVALTVATAISLVMMLEDLTADGHH